MDAPREPDRPDHRPLLADDDPRLLEAVFRYGVIADLVTRELDRGALTALVRQAAAKRYRKPDGREVRVAPRTIWLWLERYRRQGIDALVPARRKDAGASRRLTDGALGFAADRRREDRARSAGVVLDMIERAGQVAPKSVSRQTVDRALRRLGLERIRPGKEAPRKVRRRIEVEGPNVLWVGDYHDPVAFPLHGGGAIRVHVGAFIDHFSRFVPYAAYYRSQAIYTLEDVFKKSVLRAGRPELIYVDNAKTFRSAAFTHAAGRIGTCLTHSRPYESEGRGMIERFWQTVQSFEREVVQRGVADLADLNRLFWAWLEEYYHERIHEETKASPNARRQGFVPVFPSVATLAELFLVKVTRKVNKRLSTVEVEGVAFHVDPTLRGRRVQVHYDPHDLTSVVIYFDGRRLERAERAQPNQAPTTADPASEPVSTSFDYLGQLLIDHERRRAREAKGIDFTTLDPPAHFDLDAFAHHLEIAMGRPLKPSDRAAAQTFVHRYGPLDERLVQVALQRAQTSRGRGLHVTVYLDFVKAFHIDKGGTAP